MSAVDVALLIVGSSLVIAVLAQAVHFDLAFGLRYSASARDEERSSMLSRRLGRVVRNQMEGVAMFVPLAIVAQDRIEGAGFAAACLAYAISRPIHGVFHATGAGWVRSATWIVGITLLIFLYGSVFFRSSSLA